MARFATRRRVVRRIDRTRATVTHAREGLAKRLASFLAGKRHAIAVEIVRAIHAAEKMVKAEGDEERQRLLDEIQRAIDLGDWAALVPELVRLIVGVTQDGIHVGFDQIRVDPGADLTDLVNERAVEWATARAAEMVGMRLVDGQLVENPDAAWRIDEGTRALLRGDIADAIDEGLSTGDLADHLAGSYAFSDERADVIARTEMARADVAGNRMAYDASGVVEGKEWMLGSEHDDDDECDDAAAMGVVPLDSDFGGIGDPPAHPRCVCDILPVVMEPGEGGDE